MSRLPLLLFSFCFLFLSWMPDANAQKKKQPIDTLPGQWTLRVDVLTSEAYNGITYMPGVDYRKGRHKFHAGLLLGPLGRGVTTNVFGPYFAYRYFVPEKISFLRPYASASFCTGYYNYKGPVGEKAHHVLSAMLGLGCEVVVDKHFFLDANICIGPRYMKMITTIEYPGTEPSTTDKNVILAPELRIGIGYTF